MAKEIIGDLAYEVRTPCSSDRDVVKVKQCSTLSASGLRVTRDTPLLETAFEFPWLKA